MPRARALYNIIIYNNNNTNNLKSVCRKKDRLKTEEKNYR